jgi:hypothetical protein
MPLETHIETFEMALRAKGDTEEHVRRTLSSIRGLAEAWRWRRACGRTNSGT